MEIIRVNNLSKKFPIYGRFSELRGFNYALQNVSFAVGPEKILGIIGESGSGKTTMARILVGLLDPTGGNIEIFGKNITDYTRAELSGQIQLIFQNPVNSLNPKLSIRTILSEAISKDQPESRQLIRRVLDDVLLDDNILPLYPTEISGGQAQRVAIARAMLKKPKIIIADEPLSALDVSVQAQIINIFLRLRRQDDCHLIFISHDLVTTRYIADEIIILQNGTIIEEGPVEKIFSHSVHPYTQKLLAANITL